MRHREELRRCVAGVIGEEKEERERGEGRVI
jgi:hypothetical protein